MTSTPTIAEWIRQASTDLACQEGSISLGPLRKLERRLSDAAHRCVAKDELFVVFFLIQFIQDVFSNLTGDVRYSDDVERVKQDTFLRFAQHLEAVAAAMTEGDAERQLQSCGEIVESYLSSIRTINSLPIQEVIYNVK